MQSSKGLDTRSAQPFAQCNTDGEVQSSLRKRLEQTFICRRCGGSRVQSAVEWRGRGNFDHGGAHYGASRLEELTPERHCCCPGSALWERLYAQAPPDERAAMKTAWRRWDRAILDHAPLQVEIGLPDGTTAVMTPAEWRAVCRERWVA